MHIDVALTFTISINYVISVPSFTNTACSVADVTTNSVRLSWPSVTGATSYSYNYGSGDANVNTATSVNVKGLTSATKYTFTVTVHGQSGTGNTITCTASTGKLKRSTLNL